MPAEIITKEDLQQFKRELIEELKILIYEKYNAPEADEWLRSSHVRKLMHISPGTLQNLRVQGKLRYTKIGSLFFYHRKDLDILMEVKR